MKRAISAFEDRLTETDLCCGPHNPQPAKPCPTSDTLPSTSERHVLRMMVELDDDRRCVPRPTLEPRNWPSSKLFPRPLVHVLMIATVVTYKNGGKSSSSYYSLHPESHQRARKSLCHRLRLLPRHLDHTEKPLDPDAQATILTTHTCLAQHAHCARAVARTPEEFDGLEDVVERGEVGYGRHA